MNKVDTRPTRGQQISFRAKAMVFGGRKNIEHGSAKCLCTKSSRRSEKITARMAEKVRFGRKIGGGLLDSRGNHGQNGRKSKFWP